VNIEVWQPQDELTTSAPTRWEKRNKTLTIYASEHDLCLCAAEIDCLTEDGLFKLLSSHPNPKAVKTFSLTQHAALEAIPLVIGAFENVTVLNMSSNGLTDLPLSLVYLRQLKVLNLSDNKFRSLPPITCHLVSMEILLLADNHLETLPTALLHLTKLRTLDVSGNTSLIAPPLRACLNGVSDVMKHLEKRLGRQNVWRDSKRYYTEDGASCRRIFEMKSLLELSVAAVLLFKVDYLTMQRVPPILKRHLNEETNAAMSAIKVCKCNRCSRFFSNQANFEAHDCPLQGRV
jgi:hypothetical protein